jgi:hypothetical protein
MISLVLGTSSAYASFVEMDTAEQFPKFISCDAQISNQPLENLDVARFTSTGSGPGSPTLFFLAEDSIGRPVANAQFSADAYIISLTPDGNGIYPAQGYFSIFGAVDLGRVDPDLSGFVCAFCEVFSGRLGSAAFTDEDEDGTNDTIKFETFDLGGLVAEAGLTSEREVLSFEDVFSVDFSSVDGFADAFSGEANAVAVVPVPAALPLFASALLGFAMLRRRDSGDVVVHSGA